MYFPSQSCASSRESIQGETQNGLVSVQCLKVRDKGKLSVTESTAKRESSEVKGETITKNQIPQWRKELERTVLQRWKQANKQTSQQTYERMLHITMGETQVKTTIRFHSYPSGWLQRKNTHHHETIRNGCWWAWEDIGPLVQTWLLGSRPPPPSPRHS